MTIPILLLLGTLAWGFRKLFIVPSNLAHIPRVSILSLLWSYISKEPESERIQRLFLPLANESGHPIILVWTFGLWIIHVLDFKASDQNSMSFFFPTIPIDRKTALRDRRWVRQLPPQDLIWRLVGRSNLAFTIGETWRKHSKAVTTAFQGPPPIESIVRSSKELFTVLGEGGTFKWNDLTLRVTLDILGDAILGHQFKAVLQPHSPFKYFPRRDVIAKVEDLRARFGQLIREKEKKKGADVISRMLECEDLTIDDVLDNVSVLFVAGHDTAAGALSSLVYYLAKYPTYQNQARDEAKKVIQNSDTLDQEMLTKMPFGLACIQETMRMNNSSNSTLPREADTPMILGEYHIPPKTMMCCVSTFQAFIILKIPGLIIQLITLLDLYLPAVMMINLLSLSHRLD
ncbi:hypothetical protein Clacol_007073 [Clathrus columnatus]|uniref:Cytochrome P450 n=1 Tax=Clathrus columnatus TaxID=1419009 RepID=A0AAV5AH59_9AGAM|nr:hypothetical protein Clacol_007073 [Clathrus columnatus]